MTLSAEFIANEFCFHWPCHDVWCVYMKFTIGFVSCYFFSYRFCCCFRIRIHSYSFLSNESVIFMARVARIDASLEAILLFMSCAGLSSSFAVDWIYLEGYGILLLWSKKQAMREKKKHQHKRSMASRPMNGERGWTTNKINRIGKDALKLFLFKIVLAI